MEPKGASELDERSSPRSSDSANKKERGDHVEDLQHQTTAEPLVVEKGVNDEQKRLHAEFAAHDAGWHSKMTRKLMRKVDIHLLPLLVAMYLLNFLDRGSIGNARVNVISYASSSTDILCP